VYFAISSLPVPATAAAIEPLTREYYRGKYHCTVDLLFGRFGLVCFANKNKNYQDEIALLDQYETGQELKCLCREY
jgi:hypothetical protein